MHFFFCCVIRCQCFGGRLTVNVDGGSFKGGILRDVLTTWPHMIPTREMRCRDRATGVRLQRTKYVVRYTRCTWRLVPFFFFFFPILNDHIISLQSQSSPWLDFDMDRWYVDPSAGWGPMYIRRGSIPNVDQAIKSQQISRKMQSTNTLHSTRTEHARNPRYMYVVHVQTAKEREGGSEHQGADLRTKQ